jgi:hypothetical protein
MKSTVVMAFIVTVALFGAAAPGMAHHSSAMFDQSKTVTLEGVVKKMGADESSFVAVGGCEGEGRKGRHLGIRGGRAEHIAASGNQAE